MLVLSRQRDETIMIGDEVEVTVVDIRGDKVRLGITAPRSIQVHRKEVYEAIKRENRQASGMSPDDLPDVSKPGSAPGGARLDDRGEKPGDARGDKRTRNGELRDDDPQGPLNR